jgi:hypothetical protein
MTQLSEITARPNEIESIFFSKIGDIQDNLNKIIGLLKKSKAAGKTVPKWGTNNWDALIEKYADLKKMDETAYHIFHRLEWILSGNDTYGSCGDG